MYNHETASAFLKEAGMYPGPEAEKVQGLHLHMENDALILQGTAADLIELADLLISLALSGEPRGQHWHLDSLNLMDESSEIPELILLRK